MKFDTVIMVDWSGGADRGPTPKADAIWAAVAREDGAEAPRYFRNRRAAEAWLGEVLAAEIAEGRRVLAGFDFPFGYPAGFAAALTGRPDPLAVWDWFAENLTDTPEGNNRFELAGRLNARFPGTGPFWFNGLGEDIGHLPRGKTGWGGHGFAERRWCERLVRGTFSLWQMGGAGAVGSQAMTGMAALARLRAAMPGQVAVWPFEDRAAPVVLAEVWPSLLPVSPRPGEVKDAAQVRILADVILRWQRADELGAVLEAVPAEARAEEGWILGLMGDGTVAPVPPAPLEPPPFKDNCFALPRGVDWMPVDAALERLRAALSPVSDTETLPTAGADGRVLATAVMARRSNPPAANSAVDGYGFAHGSTDEGTQRLPLLAGRAAAGQPYGHAVPPGQAIRILTGAILPEGVDTVVLEEDCATDGNQVAFGRKPRPGANTRKAGEDVAAGAQALPAGHRLRPPDLALLTALGVGGVSVLRPLRVAVLSTGDELLPDPSAQAALHQIYDANRPMLLSLIRRWGHVPVDLGHAPDDEAEIAARLDRGAREADLILTSGGASAGDEDHVSRLLRDRGQLVSWRVAVKPGRPLAMALWQGTPVMGLPGNPVAAFVTALIFARPALSLMSGAGWRAPEAFLVPAAFEKRKKPGRREYLRARLNDQGAAEVFESEGSGRISGLAWATGLVELPDGAAEIAPGTAVRFLPYAGFGL